MKKTAIVLALVIALTSALCGCNNGGGTSSSTSSGSSEVKTSSVSSTVSSEDDNDGLPKGDTELINSWGYMYNPRTEGAAYKINVEFDYAGAAQKGTGLIGGSKESNGFCYVVDNRNPYLSIAIDAAKEVEDILPTYQEQFFDIVKYNEYYSASVENQKITVDSTERVKVNEYEMCVSKGKYSFDVNGLSSESQYSGEYPYVCYATFLTTGTPVYWVCLDLTDDKSKSADIDELALKMAKTLREFVPESEKD